MEVTNTNLAHLLLQYSSVSTSLEINSSMSSLPLPWYWAACIFLVHMGQRPPDLHYSVFAKHTTIDSGGGIHDSAAFGLMVIKDNYKNQPESSISRRRTANCWDLNLIHHKQEKIMEKDFEANTSASCRSHLWTRMS